MFILLTLLLLHFNPSVFFILIINHIKLTKQEINRAKLGKQPKRIYIQFQLIMVKRQSQIL